MPGGPGIGAPKGGVLNPGGVGRLPIGLFTIFENASVTVEAADSMDFLAPVFLFEVAIAIPYQFDRFNSLAAYDFTPSDPGNGIDGSYP